MKNYFTDGWTAIKKVIYDDRLSFYIFAGTIFALITDTLIWKYTLVRRDLPVYGHVGIYPLQYLVVVLVINTTLSLFSYDKEKEISYLLLSANLAISLLVFVLEIFYLSNSY